MPARNVWQTWAEDSLPGEMNTNACWSTLSGGGCQEHTPRCVSPLADLSGELIWIAEECDPRLDRQWRSCRCGSGRSNHRRTVWQQNGKSSERRSGRLPQQKTARIRPVSSVTRTIVGDHYSRFV